MHTAVTTVTHRLGEGTEDPEVARLGVGRLGPSPPGPSTALARQVDVHH